MTVLLPNGKQSYSDNAGAPLSGGKVYTYQAGTNVPQPTWPDAAKTVPNTNPVILDARGEAPIFWEGVYKVTLKDALDNLIWTIDNISSTDPLVASLAVLGAAGGSALVGYSPGGAGATTRNVSVKLREVEISITDFGGVPGLGTDNTAAFNAALAAIGDNYGSVKFPGGYNWRGNFLSNQNNVELRGGGGIGELNAKPCLRPWDIAKPTVQIGNGTGYVRKNSIENIVISGDDGAGHMAPAAVLLTGGCYNFTSSRLDIMDGLIGLDFLPSNGLPVTCCFIEQLFSRNDYANAASRNIRVRRLADPAYATALHIGQMHSNTTGGGAVLEVNGTGSPGLVFHVGRAYSDFDQAGGCSGIKIIGGAVVEADWWQLDPGASPVPIIEIDTNTPDLTGLVRGFIEGVGNQLIKLANGTLVPISAELGIVSRQPLFSRPNLIGPLTWTNSTDPFNTLGNDLPFMDMKTTRGPLMTFKGLGTGQQSDHGAQWKFLQLEEEITLSTVGTQTLSTTNLLPQDSIIEAVGTYVTQAITGAAAYSVGDPVTAARFIGAVPDVALGAGRIGFLQADQTGAAGPRQPANAKIAINANVPATAGKIRVVTFYRTFIQPTS